MDWRHCLLRKFHGLEELAAACSGSFMDWRSLPSLAPEVSWVGGACRRLLRKFHGLKLAIACSSSSKDRSFTLLAPEISKDWSLPLFSTGIP
ncbi:unnamed protein product [Thelazia callipaeda]|uniref:Uncharacterized protein n=1 Tax=Thelazia callipaeda TaxID=103827 RepID=A0A0N5D3U3_THECL|nr:unnamed protein product [Thelazia callipaeda]